MNSTFLEIELILNYSPSLISMVLLSLEGGHTSQMIVRFIFIASLSFNHFRSVFKWNQHTCFPFIKMLFD